jgi:hypothetical protein
MSKREKEASNTFRPSDRSLTEYEKEQIALRKNLERLRAQRLAREAAKSKDAWKSELHYSGPVHHCPGLCSPYGSIKAQLRENDAGISN